MAQPLSDLDIEQMTVPQRLELIGTLWDSIPETVEALPLPGSHWEELERRIARAELLREVQRNPVRPAEPRRAAPLRFRP